jgi:hypothetical protein
VDGLVGVSGPSVHLFISGRDVAGGLQIPWQDESILTFRSPLPAATEPTASPPFFTPLHLEIMKASLFSIIAAAALFTSTASFAAAGPYDNHRNDRDDRNSKDFNYGFDKKHRVTPQERARWEAAHRDNRNDDRRDDRQDNRRDEQFDRNQNYGFDRDHRVTPQERARWEASHRNNGHR